MEFIKKFLYLPNLISALIFYSRGIILLSYKKHAEAISQFLKVISLEVDYPFLTYSANKYIGLCYFFLGNIGKSKEFLLNAYRLKYVNKVDSELYWGLGWVYDCEANLLEAKRYYEQAIKDYRKIDLTDISYIKDRLNKIDEYKGRKRGGNGDENGENGKTGENGDSAR